MNRRHILIFGALASLLLPWTANLAAADDRMACRSGAVRCRARHLERRDPAWHSRAAIRPAKDLGQQMRLGIEAAFRAENDDGGVNGRMLRLVAADDGYEPSRTAEAMRQLYERDQVFGFIGNVGNAHGSGGRALRP